MILISTSRMAKKEMMEIKINFLIITTEGEEAAVNTEEEEIVVEEEVDL